METTHLTPTTILIIVMFLLFVLGGLSLMIWAVMEEQKEKNAIKKKEREEDKIELPENVEEFLNHIDL